VLHNWIVSTARRGYRTPIGTFRPLRLERVWYSTVYDNAPMPYSVFFHRGYAIHGTTEISKLGRPVSHGCVRLHPDNARMLFELIRRYGRSATTIVVRP
jgi:lipoprotein-anchoring transpeptidase ErfK/SrfK